MPSFHQDTVTRLRALVTDDRYGDQSRDWPNAAAATLSGCRLVPAAGSEDTVDRDQITRRWLLFVPGADTDLLATDRIRWRGQDFDVDGEVRRWQSATGNLGHLELDLMRVEG